MNLTQQGTKQNDFMTKFTEHHKGFKYPNVLLMGQSGAGKTRSICNLDPKKTLVIVTEKSTLTFPKARAFYEANAVRDLKNFNQIMQCIMKESMNKDIDIIVLDSFTGLWRSALKMAQQEAQGFAVWDKYANYVQSFLDLISDIKQICIVIAHSEKFNLSEQDGDYEIEVFIEGRKIKKIPVSSQFEITLFSKKDYETDSEVRYNFYTNALRFTPAKSPEGMMDRVIPNDLNLVVQKIKEYGI